MSNSTVSVGIVKAARKTKREKPEKPRPDFPLWAHPNGQWCRKIRGKPHYFGVWADPKAALATYLDQRDDLLAGRTPRVSREGIVIRDLLNRFLNTKRHMVENQELSNLSFLDYLATCKIIANEFGKTRLVENLASDDFERFRNSLSKTRGPVTIGNEIQRVRVVFKYGYDAGLIDSPIRFGPGFKRPSKRVLRQNRKNRPPKFFEADEIRAIIEAADVHMRAMVLLGINCGFGNNDVGKLPKHALDIKAGWIDFPRPKTAIDRRCKLWTETVEALGASIAKRTTPNNEAHCGLVFITKYGASWNKDTSDNPISNEMVKLLKRLDLHRPGVAFYALRHTFETIGGGCRDQIAVNHIMGHADDSMAAVYRERIDDERLVGVTDHIHKWLWPAAGGQSNG